jgi:acyl carrier protein
LPLTGSGKVDRRALPAPERSRPELERAFTAPATELEKALAAIWRDLLGLPKVGIHDSFFELGGQSLLLARVQSELQRLLGIEVSMVELFEHPTLAELARHVEARRGGAAPLAAELERGRQDAVDDRAKKRQAAVGARRRPVEAGS